MIILKSFYRKKNIRIYLTVITLIFTAIISLFIARNYNVEQANKNFSKSYLMFDANKEEIELLEEMKELSNITYGIKSTAYLTRKEWNTYKEPRDLILIASQKVATNHAIANYEASFFFYMYSSEFYLGTRKLEFTIDKFLEQKKEEDYNYLYINSSDFNNLSKEVNEYTYIINLNKWLNRKNVIQELKEKIPSLKNFEEYEYNIKILDYSQMNILIFTVLLIVLSIIYIIVLVINIKNILIDESKNTRLYQCLGFTNTTIKKYHILEIASLLILSLIISAMLVTLILLIF